jgi:hypothetical protein
VSCFFWKTSLKILYLVEYVYVIELVLCRLLRVSFIDALPRQLCTDERPEFLISLLHGFEFSSFFFHAPS